MNEDLPFSLGYRKKYHVKALMNCMKKRTM
uniref:Uncharacterized protein n=1 Tax=Arundo donax TaxID=35708 RepID=A0A0A9G633_ARUDO